MDGWVCSQHEVAVLYVDRIVVHPMYEQARPRPAWVGESLPCVGAPKFARAVPACLVMRSPFGSSRATVIHGGEGVVDETHQLAHADRVKQRSMSSIPQTKDPALRAGSSRRT
jgi:hypothetical protein